MTFGYEIKWGGNSCSVSGCSSQEEAKEKCVKFAKDLGWTPPKWWQFWRWGDTPNPR